MTVKMEDVKKVREITGAGMSSCKDALVRTEGNVDEAVKLLQKEGRAASNARINKQTSEGRIFSYQNGNVVTMYAVKCETDFVANSEEFKSIELYRNKGETLEAVLDKLKISMRENIQLGDSIDVTYNEGDAVATYIHSDGKSGAVAIIKGYDSAKINETIQFAFDTCLHMVAFTPMYISTEDISVTTVNEKREIFTAQMNNDPKMANKPDKVKEGILEGKIKKALAELCLMDQPFVKDDKHSVAEVLKRECGPDAKIVAAKLITL